MLDKHFLHITNVFKSIFSRVKSVCEFMLNFTSDTANGQKAIQKLKLKN